MKASDESAASFEDVFHRLVDLTGLVPDDLVEPDDHHEEHKRYAVYLRVVDRVDLRPLLLTCLADDPDPPMTSDMLVKVLDRVDASQRRAVADLARGWPQVFAQAQEFVLDWAQDLDKLDALRVQNPEPSAIQALLESSDRLQRRVAQEVSSVTVLRALGELGRTRRVRGAARQRLAAVDRGRLNPSE